MSQFNYDKLSSSERKDYLLKVLGFSSGTISNIKNGEVLLGEALQARINEVINNPNDTTQCAIVCQNIRRDGVSYETMDATPYLEHIGELKSRGGRFADDEPVHISTNPYVGDAHTGYPRNPDDVHVHTNTEQYNREQYPQEPYRQEPYAGASVLEGAVFARPFVRYFARFIDLMIGRVAIILAFVFILRVNPLSLAMTSYSGETTQKAAMLMTVYDILAIGIVFIVEPLLIHFFGTTPGKRIFGIRIVSEDGSRLTLGQAFRRSALLLIFGCGVYLPVLYIITQIVSFNRCRRGTVLRWDIGIRIESQGPATKKNVLPAIFIGIGMGILATACIAIGNMVPNKGRITEDQFYENCKHLVQYENITFTDVPDYIITTDSSGYVKSVRFVADTQNEDRIYPYYNEMDVALMALDSDWSILGMASMTGIGVTGMLGSCFSDYTAELEGVTINNTVEVNGYSRNITGSYLYESPDSESHTYRQVFTVTVK